MKGIRNYQFTSESASEGQTDKVCDLIADRLLDEFLAQDPEAKVGLEVMYKGDFLAIAGEVTSTAQVNIEMVARSVLDEVGYRPGATRFHSQSAKITVNITKGSPEIEAAISHASDTPSRMGASDQGIMFGFASDETASLLPLPIALAHSLGKLISASRRSSNPSWLLPDGKTAVTVRYVEEQPVEVTSVLVSTQHASGVSHAKVEEWVRSQVVPVSLGRWLTPTTKIYVNPLGSFTLGGPEIDCGVTGRKIVADTYGGMARIGGGSLNGKDPTKMDRSATYFCRWIAQQVVVAKLAHKVEIQVAYGFGLSMPLSVRAETFGTGDDEEVANFVNQFDFRPDAIIDILNLKRPIYANTANYGHFGKPELSWELGN